MMAVKERAGNYPRRFHGQKIGLSAANRFDPLTAPLSVHPRSCRDEGPVPKSFATLRGVEQRAGCALAASQTPSERRNQAEGYKTAENRKHPLPEASERIFWGVMSFLHDPAGASEYPVWVVSHQSGSSKHPKTHTQKCETPRKGWRPRGASPVGSEIRSRSSSPDLVHLRRFCKPFPDRG